MSRIKGKDTGPEVRIRSALHRRGLRGLRFRKHGKELPGRPDIIFSKARVAVFVDGDFWHGYRFSSWENKMSDYWKNKISNRRIDLNDSNRPVRTRKPGGVGGGQPPYPDLCPRIGVPRK